MPPVQKYPVPDEWIFRHWGRCGSNCPTRLMEDFKMNLSGFEQRLREERAQLQNLRDISDAGRKPVELDQASVGRLSRMDAMQMQAMAAASERRRQMRITAIDAALARLAEGEFGYCVSCGEEIGTRRLELDPAAASCISCAAKV